MAWKMTSQNIYQNPTYPRSSIIKQPNGGWVVHCRGNVRGPFKTLKEAKAKGVPWIKTFKRGR